MDLAIDTDLCHSPRNAGAVEGLLHTRAFYKWGLRVRINSRVRCLHLSTFDRYDYRLLCNQSGYHPRRAPTAKRLTKSQDPSKYVLVHEKSYTSSFSIMENTTGKGKQGRWRNFVPPRTAPRVQVMQKKTHTLP